MPFRLIVVSHAVKRVLTHQLQISFAGYVALYYLPYLICDEILVRLPCPANDLVRFCNAIVEEDTNCRVRRTAELLGGNPTLLFCSLNDFYQSRQHCSIDLLQLATQLPEVSTILDAQPTRDTETDLALIESTAAAVRRFVSRPKKLTKRLNEFLRCGLPTRSIETSRLFERIVSRKLGLQLADQNKKNRDRKAEQVAIQWLESFGDAGESSQIFSSNFVESLWRNTRRLLKLQQSFDDQLHIQKMASLRQLAYGASHEINNPLANIASRAQSLMLDEVNPDRRYRMSVIFSQAMRAHEMISDMMLFAHLPQIEHQPTDLKSLAKKLVRELFHQLKSREIQVIIRQYPGVHSCPVDPCQIAVAFKALLENSMQAIGAKGKIEIRIWPMDPRNIGISFTDSGPGVRLEHQQHLFDPFFSGREAGRGIGCGLSKAWRIIDGHGGRLSLDKSFELGARFEIVLPVSTKQLDSFGDRAIDNARAA